MDGDNKTTETTETKETDTKETEALHFQSTEAITTTHRCQTPPVRRCRDRFVRLSFPRLTSIVCGLPMPKWLRSKLEEWLETMTGEMKSVKETNDEKV